MVFKMGEVGDAGIQNVNDILLMTKTTWKRGVLTKLKL